MSPVARLVSEGFGTRLSDTPDMSQLQTACASKKINAIDNPKISHRRIKSPSGRRRPREFLPVGWHLVSPTFVVLAGSQTLNVMGGQILARTPLLKAPLRSPLGGDVFNVYIPI